MMNERIKNKIIDELKKGLVYNEYRDVYVIRGENLPFLSENLLKLFNETKFHKEFMETNNYNDEPNNERKS